MISVFGPISYHVESLGFVELGDEDFGNNLFKFLPALFADTEFTLTRVHHTHTRSLRGPNVAVLECGFPQVQVLVLRKIGVGVDPRLLEARLTFFEMAISFFGRLLIGLLGEGVADTQVNGKQDNVFKFHYSGPLNVY